MQLDFDTAAPVILCQNSPFVSILFYMKGLILNLGGLSRVLSRCAIFTKLAHWNGRAVEHRKSVKEGGISAIIFLFV